MPAGEVRNALAEIEQLQCPGGADARRERPALLRQGPGRLGGRSLPRRGL